MRNRATEPKSPSLSSRRARRRCTATGPSFSSRATSPRDHEQVHGIAHFAQLVPLPSPSLLSHPILRMLLQNNAPVSCIALAQSFWFSALMSTSLSKTCRFMFWCVSVCDVEEHRCRTPYKVAHGFAREICLMILTLLPRSLVGKYVNYRYRPLFAKEIEL